MTELQLAGLLVVAVGAALLWLGLALINADTLTRTDDVAGGVCILLGTACALSGAWALSGGAA